MKIEGIRTLSGPNIYHHRPVLVMSLELGPWVESSSDSLPGFVDRLLAHLPGLCKHRCSRGYEGGFVERLREGTFPAHVTEHVALELSELVGIGVGFGKARHADKPGRDSLYHVIVRYRAEEGMKACLRLAVELVEALLRDVDAFPLAERLEETRRLIGRTDLGPSTRAIVSAAEARQIPWFRLNDMNLIQLGYGAKRRLIQAAVTDRTSLIAAETAQDKELTKSILRAASIRVPAGKIVETEQEAIEAFRDFGAPVVVKPLRGHHGKGVSLGIRDENQLLQAFRLASEYDGPILIEENFLGRDFRALVVDYRLVAMAERVPAHVVGDGKRTISELIEAENRNPLRGEGHGFPLTQIEIDEAARAFLERNGTRLDQVPAPSEVVYLRGTANLSTGGTAMDVTSRVHPDIRTLCERAARIIGLDICGIDLILEDSNLPLRPDAPAGIIEVNAGPGLRMHLHPSQGEPRDAGSAIVEMLFPKGAQEARIPVISITGTNGKTTVTRMIGHILTESGAQVGMTTSDGIQIGKNWTERGDTTGPRSARAVLTDPSVEVAVLETARGGILKGLAYDWSDISVMTNIQPDHIGQDGVKDVDDLLKIKSLVAERVREGGTLILNAEDERLASLPESPALTDLYRKIVYFSLGTPPEVARKHLSRGGLAYFLRDGWIIEAEGKQEVPLIKASSIPVTFSGAALYNVANSMAAIAAARAYGISHENIIGALRSFSGSKSNMGRSVFYEVGQGYLLLDYAHNPEAIRAISEMVCRWKGSDTTCILGLPGDRSDAVLADSARIVSRCFSKIIIREDYERRGRRAGELPELIRRTIEEDVQGRSKTRLEIILDEKKALEGAIREMKPGELVVLFYDELDPVMKTLSELGAKELTTAPGDLFFGPSESKGPARRAS